MVRWCIRLTRLTLVCEVIRYRPPDTPPDHPLRMVRWCIRLTRLTLVCEVIRYRLVQVRQNQKKPKKKKTTTMAKKNRYSREIHEVDLQFDHVISCNIELRFDIDVTCGICMSRARVADRSRCRMISHDRTADQSHEYLGCNDFFWPG